MSKKNPSKQAPISPPAFAAEGVGIIGTQLKKTCFLTNTVHLINTSTTKNELLTLNHGGTVYLD